MAKMNKIYHAIFICMIIEGFVLFTNILSCLCNAALKLYFSKGFSCFANMYHLIKLQ